MITRRRLLAAGSALMAAGFVPAAPALAHHGWRWTEDGTFELTGVIKAAQLGNPHGVLTVDVEGEDWTVEVGQPWRNQRAGLTDDLLSVGRELTVTGARSADAADKRVKAERVTIDGTTYILYSNR
ncbi:MAG: DUF6152 family protein [Kiloniellaceae bacterium]